MDHSHGLRVHQPIFVAALGAHSRGLHRLSVQGEHPKSMCKVAERWREVEGEDFAKHWFILGRVLGSSKRDVASSLFFLQRKMENLRECSRVL